MFMEHVTDINKKPYIEKCKEVVGDVLSMRNIQLSDHELTILTEEIMDTALMMGGDYAPNNIRELTLQYIKSDFLPRFLKAHQ